MCLTKQSIAGQIEDHNNNENEKWFTLHVLCPNGELTDFLPWQWARDAVD
jgi:hypothetical protein